MPIYEFHCPKCEHRFDEIMSVDEYMRTGHKLPCPECFHLWAQRAWTPCALKTATRWASRQGTLLDQFGDTPDGRKDLEFRVKAAKRMGYKPGMHDVYDPTVATSPGNPNGFIPQDDPQGHMRRVMAANRVGCEDGLVKAKTPDGDPGAPKPLAEDVTTELVQREIKKNPDLAHADQSALRQKVINTHSYSEE
jgi:putative FmdB family regulatory protein